MRFCTDSGEMEFRSKGGAGAAPAGYRAWFDVPGRMSSDSTVVCGHWSAEGLRIEPNLMALDTGCVWGGALTAIRIEDRQLFQVACGGYKSPDWD
jgi:bis(5'-nucleosyl)-tetraphosphatase (symmetrical)